eukprot:1614243-Prymnesium_polylepis.1
MTPTATQLRREVESAELRSHLAATREENSARKKPVAKMPAREPPHRVEPTPVQRIVEAALAEGGALEYVMKNGEMH